MPRLVRRAPLIERIKANLDPYDLLLWLSEEFNDDAYDEWLKIWATPIGIALNILFVIARGASKPGSSSGIDDVFGDAESRRGSGWVAWFAGIIVHSLTLFCCLNALYTFSRKRHYRLFEQDVDVAPATPSAHRVRVDSSPMSSSPMRFFKEVIASTTAASRAHADPEREVWELRVWDPKPICLTVFTLFSPGHLLLYYTLLPPAPLDPRPSLTIVRAVFYGVLLSFQLGLLRTSFGQQAKDTTLLQGQVMTEYNTKYVQPALNRPVRDVGIQTRESSISRRGYMTREVDVYTPTTIIKRAFTTNPNTNYARHYDPDNLASQNTSTRRQSGTAALVSTPIVNTPHLNGYMNAGTQSAHSNASAFDTDYSSPLKPHHELLRERSPKKGDGGMLGVYSHANSPLRKAIGNNQLNPPTRKSMPGDTRGGVENARRRETGRF